MPAQKFINIISIFVCFCRCFFLSFFCRLLSIVLEWMEQCKNGTGRTVCNADEEKGTGLMSATTEQWSRYSASSWTKKKTAANHLRLNKVHWMHQIWLLLGCDSKSNEHYVDLKGIQWFSVGLFGFFIMYNRMHCTNKRMTYISKSVMHNFCLSVANRMQYCLNDDDFIETSNE